MTVFSLFFHKSADILQIMSSLSSRLAVWIGAYRFTRGAPTTFIMMSANKVVGPTPRSFFHNPKTPHGTRLMEHVRWNDNQSFGVYVYMSHMPTLLRHSSDKEPGYTRHKSGTGFYYRTASGEKVNNPKTLERIKLLGLPPAYKDVWICQDEFGHLQATGRDERGRKQYRYHTEWSAFRARKKFDHLVNFAHALPSLRRKVTRDLKQNTPTKTFVCAGLVRLVDKTAIRIGNKYYAQENGSFGATTLKRRHVTMTDDRLSLDFKAKGGKRVRCTTSDKTLNRGLHVIDELPGQRLFQYIGTDGQIYPLDSSDVNNYIGEEFSAKTFRTWRGTVAAFATALKTSDTHESLTIKAMSEAAAQTLHNTPTICRNSYIHPDIINLANVNPDERHTQLANSSGNRKRGLRKSEAQCLAFLERGGT